MSSVGGSASSTHSAGLGLDELLKLYEISITEEHVTMNLYQARVSFYFGALIAAVGAFAAFCAVMLAGDNTQHLTAGLLVAGFVLGSLLLVIGSIAAAVTGREYRSWCIKIASRAKLAQQLGLTKSLPVPAGVTDPYWAGEPVMFEEYVKSARASKGSSADFVERIAGDGMNKYNLRLFNGAAYIGAGLMAVTGIAMIGLITCALCC